MKEALKNIPWFIDGGDGPLWRVNPDDFERSNRPTVYIRLNDVLLLLEAKPEDSNA